MSDAENVRPGRNDVPSVFALALRVLRGELTEAEAIEILRSGESRSSDG